jgi:hypothetical protein
MSAPETGGTHVLVQQTDMAMTDTYHATSPNADDPNPRPPRPVTIEDVPDDDKGHDPAQAMTAFRAESPPSELVTPPASVASGTPRAAEATISSSAPGWYMSMSTEHPAQAVDVAHISPRPHLQVVANAPPLRQPPPYHHPQHPHQQQVHHPQPEVFRYLDTEHPNAIPGPGPRPFRRGVQGPPSSVSSDQASPAVLLSPTLPHARGNFPNDRFALTHTRPPPSEINSWGPPEYWPEGGQPEPFQGQASPTFPPAPMRPNGANRFPPDMQFRGPEGRGDPGPKHFQPPVHAPQRPHPRQRPPPPPSEFDQPRSPPFSPAVQDAGPGDMTGYKYLTTKLSGALFGQPITPIYRRFEVMGHRILLQLQDELCQLEDDLNQLDSLETSSRFAHGNLMPDSSRGLPEGEDHPVAKQRLEVVSEISEKLDMYCT